ncbi:hypothetical protein ACFR9U_06995 [Halorientalis brevis]|uniref:DUF7344 domain-containing protein n=1 Tax=Halorientalis brevis TaxID=1126241 RepID=A0ABD6C926_9EURY|nr:hypothetical protein [Halorientalis brevis]
MSENGGIRSCSDAVGGTARLQRDGASRDDLFEALAHARRRRSLAYLRATEEDVAVDELAKHVATAERSGGETVTAADRQRVATSLYHAHLPKLVDAGLVAWQDPDERDRVTTTRAGQSLPTELSWMPSSSDTGGE